MCKHITLVLPNRPGEFHASTKILVAESVNILGFALHSEGRAGFLNLLCSPHDKAFSALSLVYKQFCVEREVLVVKADHHVGSLKAILALIEEAAINLPTSYMAMTKEGSSSLVLEIRNERDRTRTRDLLREAGHELLNSI